jgi:HlyD family secretion protein
MSRKVLLTLPWLALLVLSTACTGEDVPRVVGQLESDRVEISADVAEPIDAILVVEGQAVVAGDPLLEQNRARIEARMAETQAALAQSRARLDELTRGPRKELIAAARANVEGARRELEFRSLEHARANSVFERQLAARETVDQARAALDSAQANLAALNARLEELLEGTTVEELRQAESAIDRIEAQLALMRIDAARHRPLAPVDGIVDSILFEPGERPAVGQPMLILLTGEQPYARIWVPGSERVGIAPGTEALVFVDGLAEPLDGRVRWVSSEAAFTPYFALTEHDRGRLTYVAKIDLSGISARLPDGIPVEVAFPRNPETR